MRPAAPLQAALLKAIEHLSETDRQRIVERGKHEGTPYVVTDRLADYPGLSEWVQAASHNSKSKPAKPVLETAGAWKVQPVPPPPPPAPAPAALPEESVLNQQFVELFTTAERPVVADSLVQSAQRPQSAAPVRPPEPVLKQAPAEPGEFTRMFQSPAVAAPPAPPPAPLPSQNRSGRIHENVSGAENAACAASVPAPTPVKEPGEFTRMFQASPSPAAPPPPPQQEQNPAPEISNSYSRRALQQDPCRTAPPCSSPSRRKRPVVPDRIASASSPRPLERVASTRHPLPQQRPRLRRSLGNSRECSIRQEPRQRHQPQRPPRRQHLQPRRQPQRQSPRSRAAPANTRASFQPPHNLLSDNPPRLQRRRPLPALRPTHLPRWPSPPCPIWRRPPCRRRNRTWC